MPIVMRRFPLLETVGVRTLVNGPESFTPDGEMLLGAVPEVDGLHVCTGMNSNGIALAAGAGRATAERIVHGRSSLDVTALDVRRFMPFEGGDRYRHRRMAELFEVMGATATSAEDFTRTRNLRRGPAHTLLAGRGAVFKSVAGYERALWYGDRDGGAEAVTRELDCARDGSGAWDRGGDAKLWLEGPDADAVVRRLTGAAAIDHPGMFALAPLLNEHGTFEALPSVLTLGGGRFLFLAEPNDAVRLATTVRAAIGDKDRAVAFDASAGWASFDLTGPRAPEVLADLAGTPVALEPGTAVATDLGFAPAHVARHADWPAWRILVPADHGAAVAEALFERAAPVGHLAAESLRVHHGVPRFGAEATGGIDAVAAGLAARLDFERGFVGRDAVLRARANAPRRTVGRFAVAAMARGLDLEPVVEGTRTVGYVTSSTYAALDGRVELFALIERDAASPKVLADGAWRPLTPNR